MRFIRRKPVTVGMYLDVLAALLGEVSYLKPPRQKRNDVNAIAAADAKRQRRMARNRSYTT